MLKYPKRLDYAIKKQDHFCSDAFRLRFLSVSGFFAALSWGKPGREN